MAQTTLSKIIKTGSAISFKNIQERDKVLDLIKNKTTVFYEWFPAGLFVLFTTEKEKVNCYLIESLRFYAQCWTAEKVDFND